MSPFSMFVGFFALDGRQVWSQIMVAPDGRSYDDKIYGLDYSPRQINLDYLQEHPDALDRGAVQSNALSYLKLLAVNLDDLSSNRMGQLVGLLGLVFFGIGFLAIYRVGYHFESFVIAAFICVGLVAPLLHNVALRHIAVIAPIVILVAGVGLVQASRAVLEPPGQA